MDALLLAENNALCKGERLAVYEAVRPRGAKKTDSAGGESFESRAPSWQLRDISESSVRAILDAAKAEGKKVETRRARVSIYDTKNRNSRIYPKQVWDDQLAKFTPKALDNGKLGGAVDHLGYFQGGNLRDTCIIWTKLELGEGEDKHVYGEFVIIGDHSAGKDFKSQCESGLDVGFSTYGYGTAHQPGEIERKQYGLGEDEYCAIMNRDYGLSKIDAVDDPSVETARLIRQQAKGAKDQTDPQRDTATPENTNTGNRPGPTNGPTKTLENLTMKTLAELKAAHPELFALHEAAITTATTAATTTVISQLETAKTERKALVDAINLMLPALSKVEGVSIPQREVSPKEFQEQVAGLNKQITDAKSTITTLTGEKAALQAQVDGAKQAGEAAKADKERREKAETKLGELLKDEKLKRVAPTIRKAAESQLALATFTEKEVEAWLKGKLEEYAALAPNLGKPAEGASGTDDEPAIEGLDDDESEDVGDTSLDAAIESVAKAFPAKKKEAAAK